jgi:hypothetical protein
MRHARCDARSYCGSDQSCYRINVDEAAPVVSLTGSSHAGQQILPGCTALGTSEPSIDSPKLLLQGTLNFLSARLFDVGLTDTAGSRRSVCVLVKIPHQF